MTRDELVTKVAEEAQVSKKIANLAINIVIEGITSALENGDKVVLVGFGKFEVSERAARIAVNPRTKEKIQIPAKKVPVFKPGKRLKDFVN